MNKQERDLLDTVARFVHMETVRLYKRVLAHDIEQFEKWQADFWKEIKTT